MKTTCSCFNLSRFTRLARAHRAENQRSYLLFLVVVVGIYALWQLFMLAMSYGRSGTTNSQAAMFFPGFILSGTIFATQYFSALRRPESSLTLLMRPASTFEKWLLAVVVVLLVYPITYTVIFTAINAVVGELGYRIRLIEINSIIATGVPKVLPNSEDYATFIPFTQIGGVALALIYTACTALAVLGSVYFRKIAALKMAALCFALFLITLFWLSIFGFKVHYLAWWSWGAKDLQKMSQLLSTPEVIFLWLSNILFWLLVPILLWLCALLALRERDLV